MSAFKESDFVSEAILELLSDNRVEEIFSYTPDILNPLTVSIQSSSKKRLILDLSHINMHVFKQNLKCEGLHTVRDAISLHFLFCFKVRISPRGYFPRASQILGIFIGFWYLSNKVCSLYSLPFGIQHLIISLNC